MTVTFGEEYELPTPVRIGHTFAGWWSGSTPVAQSGNWSLIGDLSVTAAWSANNYIITFNVNGGDSLSPMTVTFGETFTLPTPTREGYTFINWLRAGIPFNASGTWNLTNDVTLVASWTAISYTITYNPNHVNAVGNMTDSTHTFDSPASLNPNTFTVFGYTFTGWNTEADGSGTEFANSANVLNLSSINNATITLYAQWTAMSFDLSLWNDWLGFGNHELVETITVTFGQPIPTLPTPTREGHTFAHWRHVGITDWILVEGQTWDRVHYETDLNFRSIWTANTYTIRFIDEINGTQTDVDFTFGVAANLLIITDFITGRTPVEWNTLANGLGTSFQMGALVLNLANTEGAIVNLYAQWVGNQVTIEYAANGGTGTMTNTIHIWGAASSLSANAFTMSNHTFAGWNTETDGSGESFLNNANMANHPFAHTEVVTLFAQWTPNTWTIEYYANGGTGTMANTNHTWGVASNLAPNAFTREGHVFSHWNDQASGLGQNFWDEHNMTNVIGTAGSTVRLYAIWEAMTFTVNFNVNGGDPLANSSITVTFGETFTLPTPTREGHTFGRWWDETGESWLQTGTWGELMDFEMTASWEANIYTVTHNFNGGSPFNPQTTPVTFGSGFNWRVPVSNGGFFAGWWSTAEGTGIQFTDELGESINDWSIAQNTVAFARWTSFFRFNQITSSEAEVAVAFGITLPANRTITIPATYNGLSVTRVAEHGFMDSVLQNNMARTNLMTTINFPTSIVEIGNWAFADAEGLRTLWIPASLIRIGEGAFSGLSNLFSFSIPRDSNLRSIGDFAFMNNQTLSTIYLPEHLETIGSYAFQNNYSLRSVTLPESIIDLGVDVFNNSDTTIFTHHSFAPSDWDSNWNISGRPVVWGVTLVNDPWTGVYVNSIMLHTHSIENPYSYPVNNPTRLFHMFVQWQWGAFYLTDVYDEVYLIPTWHAIA